MKKRKVKLIASIASLAMVVAVMGVGVWAATQQAVRVSSYISFTATSVAADIDLKVSNKLGVDNVPQLGKPGANQLASQYSPDDIMDYAWLDKKVGVNAAGEDVSLEATQDKVAVNNLMDNFQEIASFTTDTETNLYQHSVYLNVADKEEDGYINIGAQIVYMFQIEVDASSAPVFFNIAANLDDTNIIIDRGTKGGDKEEGLDQTMKDLLSVKIQAYTAQTTADRVVPDGANTEQNAITKGASQTDAIVPETNTDPSYAFLSNSSLFSAAGAYTNADGSQAEAGTPIPAGNTLYVTVTYEFIDFSNETTLGFPYQGLSGTISEQLIGDIHIQLANSAQNLNGLADFLPTIPVDGGFDNSHVTPDTPAITPREPESE